MIPPTPLDSFTNVGCGPAELQALGQPLDQFEKVAGRLETEKESREPPRSDRMQHQRRKLGHVGTGGGGMTSSKRQGVPERVKGLPH